MFSLHGAIKAKDTGTFLELVRQGVDLEAVDEDGRTALCLAVDLDRRVDMVRVLLESKADPNAPRRGLPGWRDDSSPLILAAEIGGELMATLLVEHGADIDYRRSHHFGTRDDSSPLAVATDAGHWAIARVLVEAGADMSPCSYRSDSPCDESPLMRAAAAGQSELVQLMLEKGADVHYTTKPGGGGRAGLTALHYGCVGEDPATLRILCEGGADANAVSQEFSKHTPLHILVGSPPAALSALVVAGADPFGLDRTGRSVVEVMGVPDVLLDSRPSCVLDC